MKIVKLAVGLLLGLILVILGVASLLPSTYTVERSIVIQAPAERVFPWLAEFRRFHEWQPWRAQDPEAQYEITGQDGTIGATYRWSGKKIGSGSLAITAVAPNESVESQLEITEPRRMSSKDILELRASSPVEVTVVWKNTGSLEYPVGRLFGLMLDNFLGKDYETGLKLLKSKVESNATIPPIQR